MKHGDKIAVKKGAKIIECTMSIVDKHKMSHVVISPRNAYWFVRELTDGTFEFRKVVPS